MHPILCQIGPFTIHSYGFMLAIAIFVASSLLAHRAAAIGISKDAIYDLVFRVVLLGVAGARLFYVGLNWDYFSSHLIEIPQFWKGGLAWQGSMVAGTLAGIIYIKRKKLPFLPLVDCLAPYIALGHAIGRVGCLLNGCCYGKPASWGLYFPVWGERLQPTQLYMAVSQLVIFMTLRALQSRIKTPGRIFLLYFVLAAGERFVVEFFRADHELYFGFSIFQYTSVVIFCVALIMNARLKKGGA